MPYQKFVAVRTPLCRHFERARCHPNHSGQMVQPTAPERSAFFGQIGVAVLIIASVHCSPTSIAGGLFGSKVVAMSEAPAVPIVLQAMITATKIQRIYCFPI
jgi:hypothetical protein